MATKKQRAVADLGVDAGCSALSSIKTNTPAKQKAALISAYKSAVSSLAGSGWLTSGQATMLNAFASAL